MIKGFIKLLYYSSIILGIINVVQYWGDKDFVWTVIGFLMLHIIHFYVIYDLVAMMCTRYVYNPEMKLKAENEELRKNQGRRMAAKICLIVPVIWIYGGIVSGIGERMTTDIMIMAVIYYVIPLAQLGSFIIQIRNAMPSENAVNYIRRKKNKLSAQKIWLVLNKSYHSVKDEYIDSKYRKLKNNGFTDKYVYMLSMTELRKLYKNKPSEDMLMKQTWRWCYVISTDDSRELESIYNKVYEEYNNAGNQSVRKVLIVNVLHDSTKVLLPERFKQTEFIYYTQITNAEVIDYKFVTRMVNDVSDYHNKGFGLAAKKKKKKNILERVFRFLLEIPNLKLNGTREYFEHPELLLTRILECNEIEYEYKGGNKWLMNFYRSACVFETPERATMAMLDYWELVLRLVAIYYYKRTNDEDISDDMLVHANLMELARIIQKNAYVDKEYYEKIICKKYIIPETMMLYINYINSQLYIDFEGNQVSFLGLVSLVMTIRNKFVAHGVLTQDNCTYIWGVLYWATLILNNYMNIENFQLEEINGRYEIGYDQKISASPLIINKDGMPCVAVMQKSDKKKSYVYVNYFSGELISPEFI